MSKPTPKPPAAAQPVAAPAAALEAAAPAFTVEWWPIDRPIPYERNARKIPATAVAKLQASLKAFGWRQPIVVDDKDVILVGHGRLLAAKANRYTQVPVHVARDLSPAQAKAYRLADNRTNEESSWDLTLLAPELMELKAMDFDLKVTGFDREDVIGAVLLDFDEKEKAADGGPPKASAGYKEQYGVIVICENEDKQAEVFEKLTGEGFTCKIVVT